MKRTSVAVTIVTYNSGAFVSRCLDTLYAQTGLPQEVVLLDNASTDGTQDILERYSSRATILHNGINLGFAAAQNQAIAATSSAWVLTLNPDVLLHPDFLARLIDAASTDPGVGTVCGKLLRLNPDMSIPAERRIDSAGIVFTPAMRHLDRGWNQPDGPDFDQPEYVFGASAAAALYRRTMIDDVSGSDGFFDPDFFAYREDADVAWRAQLLGWKSLYAPRAEAHHVRRVTPGNRGQLPPVLNRHSVKNRFLLRIKNMTSDLYRRSFWAATARDLVVAGSCLINEQGSLPAFLDVARLAPAAWEKRRKIMEKRKISDEELAAWFDFRPASWPAGRAQIAAAGR